MNLQTGDVLIIYEIAKTYILFNNTCVYLKSLEFR